MKFSLLSACAVAACVCGLAGAGRAAAAGRAPGAAQEKKQEEPKVSGGERTAADKIDKAKGPEAKIQAAAEFLKKYPQSPLRPKVAEAVVADIAGAPDAQLKASLAETYLSIFTGPGEADRVNYVLLDAYIDAERSEDAFKLAGAWLAAQPEDADMFKRLTILASNEAIRNNNKFAAQGQQYGARAIALIEADKMPAPVDAAKWAAYKAEALPALYRATGIIAFKADDKETARQRLEKAAALKINDPAVYLILSDFAFNEYEQSAKLHRVAPAGAEKDALLKTATERLDKVIDAYAQAVAATEATPQYQQAATQLRQDLENYYKFRHNNSTEGLQQLIDKYKKQ